MFSLACLLGSVLNFFFHWKADFLTFSKSKLSFHVDSFTSSTFEKREISPAKLLDLDVIPSGRSFTQIRNKIGTNTVLVRLQNLIRNSRNDPLLMIFKVIFQQRKYFTINTISCNLNERPMHQTLSKAFEMSVNTPLVSTAGLLSKAVCISYNLIEKV